MVTVKKMMKKEDMILLNSRLTATNSTYMPMQIGALIIASIYIIGDMPLFTFAWIGLSVLTYIKRKKDIKCIMRGIK